jgi:DNA-binding transcriptional MerR regulator
LPELLDVAASPALALVPPRLAVWLQQSPGAQRLPRNTIAGFYRIKATVDELLIAEIGRRHRSHAALDDGGVLGMLAAIPDATDSQINTSGYRRYDARAVVELIRIRTLADAGVPLSRVRELLGADPEDFAVAVAEIDRRLRAEIRERQRHRERIAKLAAGDSMALPQVVVDYLARMREVGLSERVIEMERDGWILVSAHSPDRVPEWIAEKSRSLDDPDYLALYKAFGEAAYLSPDDPRLVTLADDLSAYVHRIVDRHTSDSTEFDADDFDPMFVRLLDAIAIEAAPSLRRLGELLAERGWTGWNRIEPGDGAADLSA